MKRPKYLILGIGQVLTACVLPVVHTAITTMYPRYFESLGMSLTFLGILLIVGGAVSIAHAFGGWE